jgi:hypothetical protein
MSGLTRQHSNSAERVSFCAILRASGIALPTPARAFVLRRMSTTSCPRSMAGATRHRTCSRSLSCTPSQDGDAGPPVGRRATAAGHAAPDGR